MTDPVEIMPVSSLDDRNVESELLIFCKATAEQIRLDILRVLSRDSFGVLELCQLFECKQSGISHHLKILADAGLVVRRREGNSIFYSRSYHAKQPELEEIQRSLFKTISHLDLKPEVTDKLKQLHKFRAEKAKQFFEENASKFKAHQEQVVAYDLYGPNTAEFMIKCLKSTNSTTKTVLEVGPGEGQFLAELSSHFGKVIALDNSQEMLCKAKAFAKRKGLSNISFVEGDTTVYRRTEQQVDCVVMNMVLHHVPSPSELFFDVSHILKKQGVLFITELCSHDQFWVKEACGDLWLGFEPEELLQLAEEAKLDEGEAIYFAQRNGFRVQIRQFIKR